MPNWTLAISFFYMQLYLSGRAQRPIYFHFLPCDYPTFPEVSRSRSLPRATPRFNSNTSQLPDALASCADAVHHGLTVELCNVTVETRREKRKAQSGSRLARRNFRHATLRLSQPRH